MKGPVVLTILDGWGIGPDLAGNAITKARIPKYDFLRTHYPFTTLAASGTEVGLKEGEPGNSEAGHMNLGAGRLVLQDKLYITERIHNGTFFRNPSLLKAVDHVRNSGGKLHIMGLFSDGNSAHSEPDHLDALLFFIKQQRVKKVSLHLFIDGRDTKPREGYEMMRDFLPRLRLSEAQIATVIGRYYAMDRADNWDRTGMAYEALVYGKGQVRSNPLEAIRYSYDEGITDEFIKPAIINESPIEDGDAVIFYNLRSDRARQITKAFVVPDECESSAYDCKRLKKFKNLFFVTLTNYGNDLSVEVAFPARRIWNTLSHYLGKYHHLKQMYIAEQEKYAHVTYFFHGGEALPESNESRREINSVDVPTFDTAPEMSAQEITDCVILNLKKQIYSLIVANYANPDILGHTGNFQSALRGLAMLDNEFGRLHDAVKNSQGTLMITADHGNVEQMIDPLSGKTDTTHTANPVPFMLIGEPFKRRKLRKGALSDVAPTILSVLGLKKPREMTGENLIMNS